MASDNDRPIAELVGDLTRQVRLLLRQELTLARAEVTEKASAASRSLVYVAAGAALGYAALLAIVAGLCLLLYTFGLNAWLSAFAVGVVIAIVAFVLVRMGLAGLRPAELALTTTVQTLQESVETLKGAR